MSTLSYSHSFDSPDLPWSSLELLHIWTPREITLLKPRSHLHLPGSVLWTKVKKHFRNQMRHTQTNRRRWSYFHNCNNCKKMTFCRRALPGLGSTGVATEASLQAISALMAFSPLKQNWGKMREANRSPGRLELIYHALLFWSDHWFQLWRKRLQISHSTAWWELPGGKLSVWPLLARTLQHARVVDGRCAWTCVRLCKDCPRFAYSLCSRWRKSLLFWEHCISAETVAHFCKLPPLPYFYLHNESKPADNEAPNFIWRSLLFLKCRNLGKQQSSLAVFQDG